ncbi:MAG: tetratricopeptide repeat protein [Thermodesulfobacteriota bacterium]|nr:MAG: tetratricopeptide repeat protein [Thermodesulfobacteriota bacterium]
MALKEKLIDKAQKLVQKGYLDKAIAEYRAAVDSDPRDVSIRLKIGDLFVKLGRKEEAIKEYTEVAKANAQRGFYLKAIAVYKQILKLDDSIEVHNKLAELYAKQRLIADAISEYSYIVTYLERRGKSTEVLDLLKKMVEVDPDNTGVRLKLAEIYQRMSFDKDAMSEYSLIFDRLVSQGKLDRAEKMYQGLYNSSPGNEQVIAGLAELYRLKGDNTQRLKLLKALLKSYNASARTEEAKKTALVISEISPDDPDASVFLKKTEEDGWAGQDPKAGPQAGAAVEAPSDEAELVSWPEEEIAVPVEAVTETNARKDGAALETEFEADAAIEPPTPLVEAPVEPPASVSDAYSPPAAGVEAGPGEVEIDIQDLLNGELPSAAGTEGLETPQETGAPSVEASVDSAPDAGPEIASEIEIEVEAEPEETLPSGGPVEAGADEGSGEEEIEIEMMPEAGIEEAAVEEAANFETPSAFPEPSEEALPETAIEAETPGGDAVEVPGEAPSVTVEEIPPVEAEEEYAASPVEAVPVAEATEPEVIAEIPGEAAPDGEEEASEQVLADLEESQEDISSAIKELMEKIEPEAADGAAKREDYVDLSAELGMEEALTDLAGSWGSEEKKDTFDEFKSGIGNQLSKEDSETHYNLGIAYMEMELFSEASKEFKIALKDPRLEFNCYTRLGLCAMAQNEPQEAVTYYLKGIKVEGRSIEERIGMMYELGLAYEAAGEIEEAEELFKGIHELAPSFREVAGKVRTSMQARSSPPPFVPLEDGLLEVELM